MDLSQSVDLLKSKSMWLVMSFHSISVVVCCVYIIISGRTSVRVSCNHTTVIRSKRWTFLLRIYMSSESVFFFDFYNIIMHFFKKYVKIKIKEHKILVWMSTILVMGNIEENRYQYSIDTQISFQKSPSRTSHPQINHVFRLSDFEFFRFIQHLPRFPVIYILDFFCHFWSLIQ